MHVFYGDSLTETHVSPALSGLAGGGRIRQGAIAKPSFCEGNF